jgi:PadR family transcriptional regulator, regulatory protein PadR
MGKTLTETSYFVLASLVDGPKHGYAIVKAASELSGGVLAIPVATVYFTLDKLAALGFIEQTHEEIVDGRARRVFAITDPGSGAVEVETQRLADATKAVQLKLAAARSTRPVHKVVLT